MTKTEQLISSARTTMPHLSDEEIVGRLFELGLLNRGYCIEPDIISEQGENGRTAFTRGFAVLKDGVVFCRKATEREAQQFLEALRKTDGLRELD